MNRSHHSHLIRLVAGVPVGLAALASIMTGPAAFASQLRPDPPGWLKRLTVPAHLPAHVHAAPAGGLPGWEIALIAAGAVVLAAVLAALAGWMRAARAARDRKHDLGHDLMRHGIDPQEAACPADQAIPAVRNP